MEDRSVISVVMEQYVKMRSLKGHTVEDDVKHNNNYELAKAAVLLSTAQLDLDLEDFTELSQVNLPEWDQEWLQRTFHKTYKDRLKVGISLLIAELERVMYLENQRISNNDSSTTSSAGNPESNG